MYKQTSLTQPLGSNTVPLQRAVRPFDLPINTVTAAIIDFLFAIIDCPNDTSDKEHPFLQITYLMSRTFGQ
jgi:hypothetical protein